MRRIIPEIWVAAFFTFFGLTVAIGDPSGWAIGGVCLALMWSVLLQIEVRRQIAFEAAA